MNADSAPDPLTADYLVKLFYQRLDSAHPTALTQWRKYLAEALEAWDLPLATRLLYPRCCSGRSV